MRAVIAVVSMGLVLVLAGSAEAGGLTVPDHGSRAMGRAGAFTAAVHDPSAVYWNPANLSLIDGFALTASANLWFYSLSIQREPFTTELLPGQPITYPYAESTDNNGFFPNPNLFLSYDFGLENSAFGLGIFGPSAVGGRAFDQPDLEELSTIGPTDTSPRDYGHGFLIETADLLLIYYGLAFGHDFGPVQIGLTFQLAHAISTVSNGVDGGGSLNPRENADEDPTLYSRTEVSDLVGFAPTGTVGVTVRPIDPLSIALTYQPRFEMEMNGIMTATFPVSIADQLDQTGSPDTTLTVTIPDVIRLGFRWAFMNGDEAVADIEFDAVYETWSLTESFVIDTQSTITIGLLDQERAIPIIEIPRGYDDTLSLRLGGDFRVIDGLLARAGVYHEGAANGDLFSRGAAREGFANIDFPAFRKTGVSVGASYEIADWSIDLAYLHVFIPEVVELEGQVPIIYPLWVCNDPQSPADVQACDARDDSPLHAVNSGTYNLGYDMVSIGLTWNP